MTAPHPLLPLIEHAIRAPSGHNTQPWRFALGADCITIAPDFSKRLPVVDPDNRELYISLGCAAENLRIAASHHGYATTTAIAADGAITITLQQQSGIIPNPLFAQIPRRQTNRATADGRRIPPPALNDILAASQSAGVQLHAWENGSPAFARLGALVMAGNTAQMRDPAFKRELLTWIRYNRKDSERTRDGLSYAVMGAPNLPRWLTALIIRLMLNPRSQNNSDRKKIAAASHLLLIASDGDNIPAWIATGGALQRLLLQLTAHGIASAWLNQPCEVPELRVRLADECPGAHPQILLRLGYAAPLPYALRRPLAEVVA